MTKGRPRLSLISKYHFNKKYVQRKPNFASLKTTHDDAPDAWKELLKKDRYNDWIFSPAAMFNMLHIAVDRAITKLKSTVKVDNQSYRYILV